MANVSAQSVKELREKTGAGMMDCKTALAETGGDLETAVDWLRKKGLAKAAKKAGRVAAEGLIALAIRDLTGVAVEVNSETDFVARNDHFQGLVKMIAHVALHTGPDIEAIKAGKVGDLTAADAVNSAIATIGENMTLRRAAEISVSAGVIGAYVHNSVAEHLGKIGVLVGLQSTGDKDELAALGRQVAMHIAASKPLALDAASLDPALVEREKNILAEKFREQGKPEATIARIVDSGIKTFYKEVCLLEQPFIHDTAKTVAQAVKDAEGRVGAPVKLTGFVLFVLGEGVERDSGDFASEVASMAGKS